MSQPIEELTHAECAAIEDAIRERQRERNGFIPVCSQCCLQTPVDCGAEMAQFRMHIRYSTLKDSSSVATPHEDVTWKCGSCQTHLQASIRLEDQAEYERLVEERGGERYDPVAAPADEEVRDDRLRALGYLA